MRLPRVDTRAARRGRRPRGEATRSARRCGLILYGRDAVLATSGQTNGDDVRAEEFFDQC